MIEKLRIFQGFGVNPHENLAIEKRLMDTTEPGVCTLYLWQNQNTVVIGKNQNAWVECRTTLLEQEGGKLARRLSGGGAVFHDVGNLNFTFTVRNEDYDLDRQLSVIARACAEAGIEVERSGRNDLIASGRKFSGNAFYHNSTHAYHHGTLMIDVDMDKLQRYLNPPKAKLEAKGVASVRSRVVNLTELSEGLTCDKMRSHMVKAFSEVYGLPAQEISLTDADKAAVAALRAEYESWEFLFGTPLPFTFSCEEHFPWGNMHLQLQVKNGEVTGARAYTDAMDWGLGEGIAQALTGCRFTTEDLCNALRRADIDAPIAEDLCAMLLRQSL